MMCSLWLPQPTFFLLLFVYLLFCFYIPTQVPPPPFLSLLWLLVCISVFFPLTQNHLDFCADLETSTPCMVTRLNSAINIGRFCHRYQPLECKLGEGRGWSVPKVGHLQGVWERLPGSRGASTMAVSLVVLSRTWDRWLELGGGQASGILKPEN